MTHRMAKLTVQGRRLLVARVRDQGWPVVAAAEAQGVHPSTVYKWLKRYDTHGEAGLADRSSRPHNCPHRLSPEREQAIVDHRRATRRGPHRIAWDLGEAPATVWRVLRRRGEPPLAWLDRPTGKPVRYQRDRPGELLHIDIKKQARIPDGGGWRLHGRDSARVDKTRRKGLGYDHLHVAVDDRSRVAYVEVLADEKATTAVGFLRRAVDWFDTHGVTVERVLTDNGACYRSRDWKTTCTNLGVTAKFTRPYRPQTNGKAERFNQTLIREWAWAYEWTANGQRTRHLDDYIHDYNYHRPHTSLKGATPMDILDNVPKHLT